VTYLFLPQEEPPPVDLPAEPPPPEVEEPPTPEPAAVPELPAGFQELEVPRVILPDIPPPAPFAIKAIDYSGMGAIGGVGEGYVMEPTDTVVTVEAPVSLAIVDRLPQLIRLDEMARRMQALYPHVYRAAGIEGRAVVQLVVDKDGRVEGEGMTLLSATHPEFGPASMELARMVRFEPARRNGRPVRVWVQLPVDWKIDD
jgi:protein TonB